MGHEGMHYSLVSREVIADSVEVVMQAERLDGSVLLAGCDKSLPGMLMAAARLDLASVFLYAGLDPARHRQAVRRQREPGHDHRRLRGGRRLRPRPDEPRGRRRDRAGHLPRRGRLRRHVHRQHDGQRRRGAGHVAARLGRAARDRPAPRRLRPSVRRGRRRAAAARHHRPRHPHPRGVRERDRGRDGLRRLDERRPAPAGDRRARPSVELDPRRLRPHRREGAAPRGRQAVRPVRHDRRRPGRGSAGRHARPARRRPDARRRADGHRPHHGREPRRHRAARHRRQGPAGAARADPHAPAASRSCRARSPPTARS